MKTYAFMAALCVALPTLAHAHASLESGEARANSMHKAVVRIPHGCDGAATRTVRVSIPEGVIAVKPMPKAGWTLATVKGDYARTYDYYGTPMAAGVKEIIWSGGDLPDEFYDEFAFRGRITDFPAGQVLAFPVVQECDSGEVAWTEIAAAGQDPHSLAHPAPSLTIVAAGDDAHGHGHAHAGDAHAGHGAAEGPVAVEDAWARASAGPAKVGAAYVTLANFGDRADRLVAASSPAAKRVEIHTHLNENGVMKMRQVDGIDVPVGEAVQLAPGGLHLMMFDLAKPLVEGERFPLTLVFEHAGEVKVEVTVQAAGAMGGGGHKHH